MSSLKFVEHKRIVGDEWNAPPALDETPHTKNWKDPVIIPFTMDWFKKGKLAPKLTK